MVEVWVLLFGVLILLFELREAWLVDGAHASAIWLIDIGHVSVFGGAIGWAGAQLDEVLLGWRYVPVWVTVDWV